MKTYRYNCVMYLKYLTRKRLAESPIFMRMRDGVSRITSHIINLAFYRSEISSGMIESLECRHGHRRETRKREVSALRTERRQMTCRRTWLYDKSTCRRILLLPAACFPEPFPFCQKSDQISFEPERSSACLLHRSVRLYFRWQKTLYLYIIIRRREDVREFIE